MVEFSLVEFPAIFPAINVLLVAIGIRVYVAPTPRRSPPAARSASRSCSTTFDSRQGLLIAALEHEKRVSQEVQLERNAPWLEQSIRSDKGRTH